MLAVKGRKWLFAGKVISVDGSDTDGSIPDLYAVKVTLRDAPGNEGQRVLVDAHKTREVVKCRLYAYPDRIGFNAYVTGIKLECNGETTYTLRVIGAPYRTPVFPIW